MNKHIIITISREFGAEGHEIGKILSERLGIKMYDKELLSKAAFRNGSSAEMMKMRDENIGARFEAPSGSSLNNRIAMEDKLFIQETQVIRDVASRESCIIVGRLADYILRHESNVLKVYIYAPEEFRIHLIMQKHRISEKDAKKMVKKMDATRRDYYKFYSFGKWSQKKGKDLSLNRAFFGIEGCVDIIETAVKTMSQNNEKE